MPCTRTALAVGLAITALAVAGCGGNDEEAAATDTGTTTETTTPSGSTLKGSVGPGFEISLSTEDGQAVETLTAGSYTIEVEDLSSAHNFHLTGPGVDETTDVAGEGASTFEVDLQSGSYSFVCDPHSSSMNGSFEVSG